ncbi:hypothetical protein F5B22DRAFT_131738 [Xylaria bambusicola]|uniref:uncharacterized protein n=1 Tax=Xylaria bambusicola TaxID=326684 RepID=UPI0020077EE7|nr:uncharacterized protein F5B22DRAFT_131738 [Xylaria bambusicola]KAI0517172.1 hypothetical protein F5B22DRAFT_131738 [Xylaria bambusicola]
MRQCDSLGFGIQRPGKERVRVVVCCRTIDSLASGAVVAVVVLSAVRSSHLFFYPSFPSPRPSRYLPTYQLASLGAFVLPSSQPTSIENHQILQPSRARPGHASHIAPSPAKQRTDRADDLGLIQTRPPKRNTSAVQLSSKHRHYQKPKRPTYLASLASSYINLHIILFSDIIRKVIHSGSTIAHLSSEVNSNQGPHESDQARRRDRKPPRPGNAIRYNYTDQPIPRSPPTIDPQTCVVLN